VSLFQNGLSLHVDAVNQQEQEEEEDEAEENLRIQQELQANLHGAFDDLELSLDESEEYDGEETVENSEHHLGQKSKGYPQELLTPGQVPLKNVTSTPFTANQYTHGPGGRPFQQLAVEETSMMEGEEYDNTYTPGTEHQAQYQYTQENPPNVKTVNFQALPPSYTAGNNNYSPENVGVGFESNDPVNRKPDYLNKSDSEKVKENERLFAMYTARGRQIEELETQIDKLRTEHATQTRQLRQHLATTAVEKEQQGHSLEELEQLLADARRENQLLKDDIHPMKEKLSSLQEVKEKLEMDHNGDKETIIQLQQKIRQLETTDTVLRARQQYDALLRSLKERHEDELQKVRMEVDKANSVARDKDQQINGLRSKLSDAQNNYDYMLREKTSLIDDLSCKCDEYQKKLLQHQSDDQALEIARLKTTLEAAKRRANDLEAESRNRKAVISNLESELSGYEAMGVDELSESMVALGLAGTSKADGVTRLKEELHKSLSNNKNKREEISRLEEKLTAKTEECNELKSRFEKASSQLTNFQQEINDKANDTEELKKTKELLEKEITKTRHLEIAVKEAEDQNIKVKKCMTEMLEGNQDDKMEAIDSLREEYEEHCKNAVEQTKSLMEGEIRRLKIELDVYNKTILELRKKLEASSKQANNEQITSLQDKIKDLEKSLDHANKEKETLENAKNHLEKAVEEHKKKYDELKADYEEKVGDDASIPEHLEAVIQKRIENVRYQLREVWEINRKGDIEEAVAAARLDWLKRLPEVEKPGGAARMSISQLEDVKNKLSAVSQEKEKLQVKLSQEKSQCLELEKIIESLRNDLVMLRKEKLEFETQSHSELCSALAKQADQWQERLTTARKQAEEQRKLISDRHDTELAELETRLRSREKEAGDLEAKLDRVESEHGLALDKWRRVLEEKNRTIQSAQNNNNGDIELLKNELNLRVEEVDRQRKEMAAMADRWTDEVKSIHATHQQEKKELAELTEKYHGLKQKVRKYQRHVEQKENHYKQEYARLESEFKSTLERLRGRMENAYSAKEREVERELGHMRNQFTEELKNIASRKTNTDRPMTPVELRGHHISADSAGGRSAVLGRGEGENLYARNKENEEPTRLRAGSNSQDTLNNIKSASLKQYYVETSREIQQLLK